MPLWPTYMFLKDQVKDDDYDYDNGGDDGDNITHEDAKIMREQFVSQMFNLLRDGLRRKIVRPWRILRLPHTQRSCLYISIKGFEISNRPSSLTKFCQDYLPLLFSETKDETNVMDGPYSPIFGTLCSMISDMYYDYNVETEEDEAMYMNDSMMLCGAHGFSEIF